jgi:hypothetical protein
MSGVFQNIDPPPPGECVPPHQRRVCPILVDARHSSVLYICKYFGADPYPTFQKVFDTDPEANNKVLGKNI